MKVLVATTKGQGIRKNDFCWVPEGELVHFGFQCDGGSVDDHCGCKRSMSGIECAKATTTMTVVEQEITQREITDKLKKFYVEHWKMGEKEAAKMAFDEVKDLGRICDVFLIRDVIEKRGNTFKARKVT